jgi:hypothetical protein
MKNKILLTTVAATALSLATPVFAQTTTTTPTTTPTTTTTPAPTYTPAPAPTPAPDDSDNDSGGFFLEPMVTWETGEGDQGARSETDGFGAGMRLGGHVGEILFLGVDGRYSFPSLQAPGGLDVDAEQWNVGALVGVQMPWFVGLRLWGNYIFSGELDPDSSAGFDTKFTDANGYRVGAGIRVAIASLNIEYQDLDYDETEVSGVFGGGTLGSQQDQQSWIFSVSFPFTM